MFGEDRRRSYSFKAHLRRVRETKGLRRLLLPLFGTALAASLAFAYCGSDGITGPSDGSTGPAGTISANHTIEVTPFPVTDEEIPSELADTEVPTNMQATACNGDVVAWEDSRTKASGVAFLNTRTGALRTKIRIRQTAKGRGTRHTTDPEFPDRWYYGFQEYEKEIFMALGTLEHEEEFELKITAKNREFDRPSRPCSSGSETRTPNDDYKLRLRVVIRISNGNLTIRSSTHEKCY